MNFVHIVGRLAKDPETRFTSQGQKVTVLIIATNSYRQGNEETIWWRATLWGERWDKMVQYFTKGKPIMVGGELKKPEIYTKNGVPHVGSIDLNADYVKFLPFGKPENAEESGSQAGAMGAFNEPKKMEAPGFSPGAGEATFSESPQATSYSQENPDEDSLPF